MSYLPTKSANYFSAEDILNRTNDGLGYLMSFRSDLEFKYRSQAKEYENKGKRKVTIKQFGDRWRLKDWTGGASGDIFQIAAFVHGLDVHRDFAKVCQILGESLNLSATVFENQAPRSTAPKPELKPYLPNVDLNAYPKPLKYFDFEEVEPKQAPKACISLETLARFGVKELRSITGKDGNQTILNTGNPAFVFRAGGNLRGYRKGGFWEKGKFKQLALSWSGNYVYGYDQLPERCKGIVFVEGENDCLALSQVLNKFGFWALALNSSSANLPPELLADIRKRASYICALYDNDEPGQKGAKKLCENDGIYHLQIPHKYNDICDFLEAKKEADLVDSIEVILPDGKQPFFRRNVTPKNGQIALPLDTIELTVSKSAKTAQKGCFGPKTENQNKRPQKNSFEWLKNARKNNLTRVKFFDKKTCSCSSEKNKNIVLSKMKKLSCCSFAFVGRENRLTEGEIFKIGQNLCKDKSCEICSYIVASERKSATLRFIKELYNFGETEYKNAIADLEKEKAKQPAFKKLEKKKILAEEIKQMNFFHVVLTLQHDEKNRAGDYSEELKEYFNDRLRKGRAASIDSVTGKKLKNRDWWKNNISGGFYSMEVKGNKNANKDDNSLHIHLHILALSPINLDQNGFVDELRKRWHDVTGDSYVIDLERAYTKKDPSKPVSEANKDYFYPGDKAEKLEKTLSEACKYTLKLDLEGLENVTGDTLASLLKPGKRFFNYFGSLYGQGISNFGYEDLKEIKQGEGLFSPTTGEELQKYDTIVSITNISNVRAKKINDVNVYDYKDHRKKIFIVNEDDLGKRVSKITKGDLEQGIYKRHLTIIERESRKSDGEKDFEKITKSASMLEELEYKSSLFPPADWQRNLIEYNQKIASEKIYNREKELKEANQAAQQIFKISPPDVSEYEPQKIDIPKELLLKEIRVFVKAILSKSPLLVYDKEGQELIRAVKSGKFITEKELERKKESLSNLIFGQNQNPNELRKIILDEFGGADLLLNEIFTSHENNKQRLARNKADKPETKPGIIKLF